MADELKTNSGRWIVSKSNGEHERAEDDEPRI
jgi:hypothetical protein